MQTVFAGFKQCLGSVRQIIEEKESLDYEGFKALISDETDIDAFYSAVILLRTDEYFFNQGKDKNTSKCFNKKSVLRMLSIWETDL